MIDTAETVAKRYGIGRDRQDEFAAEASAATPRLSSARPSTTRSCR